MPKVKQRNDTCQCSWTLKEAMSWALENNSKSQKSSHHDMEHHSNHSKSGSKSEEGSTTLEEDMFLSIWYPSPPNFPKPYLLNQDFRDSNWALKYIKGEPSTPLLNIKVESPPTPTLQYPSSPTTPSSCYHSLDPNNFMVLVKNWNKVPRAIIAMLSDYTLWHRRMGHTHINTS